MSTNISKKRREELIGKIKAIRTYIAKAEQDDNSANLLGYLSELEKEVKGRKYGLVFEEHREAIDEIMASHTPILTEDSELFIDNGGQMNFLIEGDNLPALYLLQKTHKGKVDLIYIDPPYNTGNKDFVYDDTFVGADDTYRHSKWISFISKRLLIAKSLLSIKGACFISIDDNEVANLRLICNQIFGDENLIAQFTIASNSAKNKSKHVSVTHEYLLCYAKDKSKTLPNWSVKKSNLDEYKKVCKRLLKICNTEEEIHKELLALAKYPKYYEFDHYTYTDERGPFRASDLTAPSSDARYDILHPTTKKPCKGGTRGWAYSEQEMQKLIDNRNIYFGVDEKTMPQLKNHLSDNEESLPRSILFFDSQSSTRWMKSQGFKFDFPKSISYIEYIISMYPKKDITILDFFAGSGTTGHSVLSTNKDGGNRKFILCTNNQNNICRDITYERIKRVIEAEQYEASLKYYKIDYVQISDRMYYEYADELLKHTRELVELENSINFSDNKKIAIILTDEELDAFMSDIESYKSCKKIYLGHDVLASGEQELVLKECKIKINIIPDYYYKELEA